MVRIFFFVASFFVGFRGFPFFWGVVQPKSCVSCVLLYFFWYPFRSMSRMWAEFWLLRVLCCGVFFTLHDSTPPHHPFCSLNLGNKQNIAPHLFLSVIIPLQSAAHQLFIYHGPASLKARNLDLSNMKIGF